VNLGALLPLPKWFPRFHSGETKRTARDIRALITKLTADRMAEIEAGTAPDDLATKIMTTADPVTGETFATEEMVDQVAIFFLAGHETSASALAWTLYLLAMYPGWQDRVAEEARVGLTTAEDFGQVSKLRVARDVFRESLRLYPPVPMMVREAACPERFRGRDIGKGAQVVLSPWHQHRHERLWERPDEFDPGRFGTENGKMCLRNAYMPFSAGQRVCTGAGFAMVEGPLLLAMLVRAYRFDLVPEKPAMPVAHLTVRGKDGIWLRLTPRQRKTPEP
ncbi:MAG TPA: cytochrome P450, partial [Maritimibacter sp.]|nr:cytochrome P450 [Maritimibacter sp.]